jgi:hypothetical protein
LRLSARASSRSFHHAFEQLLLSARCQGCVELIELGDSVKGLPSRAMSTKNLQHTWEFL